VSAARRDSGRVADQKVDELVAVTAKIDSIALLGMPGNKAVELELAVNLDFPLIAVWPSHTHSHEQQSRAKAGQRQLSHRARRGFDKQFVNYDSAGAEVALLA
jgi:hypothetical protein